MSIFRPKAPDHPVKSVHVGRNFTIFALGRRGLRNLPAPINACKEHTTILHPVCHEKAPWSIILYEKSYKIGPGNGFLGRFV
jgi:hypothetical protein